MLVHAYSLCSKPIIVLMRVAEYLPERGNGSGFLKNLAQFPSIPKCSSFPQLNDKSKTSLNEPILLYLPAFAKCCS